MKECYFRQARSCSATTYTPCPPYCAFRKTEKEYQVGIERAKQRLKEMGLEPCIDSIGGKQIVTVQDVQ